MCGFGVAIFAAWGDNDRMRLLFTIPLLTSVTLFAGCNQRGPVVYVLEGPQTVELTASATPSKVKQGETIVLHVTRRTSGQWKQVPRKELAPGQCWVYRPPVQDEPEVAHLMQWQVDPAGTVDFHPEYQLNGTRVATMRASGKVRLAPVSPIQCEAGRNAVGAEIEIEVS